MAAINMHPANHLQENRRVINVAVPVFSVLSVSCNQLQPVDLPVLCLTGGVGCGLRRRLKESASTMAISRYIIFDRAATFSPKLFK